MQSEVSADGVKCTDLALSEAGLVVGGLDVSNMVVHLTEV